ncbi:phage tail protein [Vibrio natriegens]
MTQTPENQQQYGSILTILGENAEQNGKLQNKQISFTHIAIGDANDTYVQPDRGQSALVNELHRIPVNSVDVLQPTPDSVPMLKVEAILPDNVNDLIIREFAAVAEFNGQSYFHAVGNCARIYVPPPVNNGNVLTPVTLEMIFVITSAEPIIEIDPNVVTASRSYVNQKKADSESGLTGAKVYPGTVVPGDTVPKGHTSFDTKYGLLIAWDSGFDLYDQVIQSITENIYLGYDVVTDHGAYEFVTQSMKKLRNAGHADGWGSAQDGDVTAQLNKAIEFNASKQRKTRAEPLHTYCVTGLNMKHNKARLSCDDSGFGEGTVTIKIIGSATLFTSTGQSVGVLLNEDIQNTKRGQQLENVEVIEGSETDPKQGQRVVGIYGVNIPYHQFNNVFTRGFDYGTIAARHWNSKADIHNFHHRVCGFSTTEPWLGTQAGNTNAYESAQLHASSNKNPPYNFDFRSINDLVCATLVTEGTMQGHILVSGSCRSLQINAIHKEGTADFLVFDKDYGLPSLPGGVVNIDGGAIFDNGGPGNRFCRVIGDNPAQVGLAQLNLGGVTLKKSSDMDESYLDLSGVCNFSTQAKFEYIDDQAINAYTWHSLGENINRTFKRSQFGHNGLIQSSRNKGIYTGIPFQEVHYKSISGPDLNTPQILMEVLSLGEEWWHEVDVSLEYNSGAFESRRFVARFWVLQTTNNQLITKLIAESDIYAKDSVFSLNGESIEFDNPAKFGTYYFTVKSTKNIFG